MEYLDKLAGISEREERQWTEEQLERAARVYGEYTIPMTISNEALSKAIHKLYDGDYGGTN